MNKQVLDELRFAVASKINQPLLAYFNARLDEIKNDLIVCSENQYREVRGRALEVQQFIQILESVKE